jgi:UDP-N-acetylglucosamine diphosphorylase/glucosamine-1-phosphate N-acetyltransferase
LSGSEKSMARFGVCIFEDPAHAGFMPLAYSRAVFELRCGMFALWEKITRDYAGDVEFFCITRSYLARALSERLGFPVNRVADFSGEAMLFINGRLLAPPGLSQLLPVEGKPACFLSQQELVAFRVDQSTLRENFTDPEAFLASDFSNRVAKELPVNVVKTTLLRFPWEVVSNNPGQIGADFDVSRQGGRIEGEVDERAVIYNARAVHISPGARIDAGVVIDARGGPVFVGTGARVSAFSRIEGPCSIGENSILVGGRITGGCSFGPCCRVGGEVEQTIFQGYSNKYHEGFIGHSYLGEWVNLGALTTNSNLRNTYTNVSVVIEGRPVQTNMLKVGTFIGDFTRTGISTLLDTGSTLGFSTNVFGGKGVFPKSVPSFVWGNGDSFAEYVLEKAVATAQHVMNRRGVAWSSTSEELMHKIFELTKEERQKLFAKSLATGR